MTKSGAMKLVALAVLMATEISDAANAGRARRRDHAMRVHVHKTAGESPTSDAAHTSTNLADTIASALTPAIEESYGDDHYVDSEESKYGDPTEEDVVGVEDSADESTDNGRPSIVIEAGAGPVTIYNIDVDLDVDIDVDVDIENGDDSNDGDDEEEEAEE